MEEPLLEAFKSRTKKVFWENPYQCSTLTTISKVLGGEVIFDKTIAYSCSGGQESDKAFVNDVNILESRISGHNIIYTLPENHGLLEGDEVTMKIDWTRRNRLMRLHFTCELILVLVNRHFGNIQDGIELLPEQIDIVGPLKKGAHMSEKNARVDFAYPDGENISSIFPILMREYEKIIEADHVIETGYINEEEEIRYWRIPGIAKVPCGGTHVRSTKEVGMIKLKRERANKGVERIKIELVDPSPTSEPYNL